VFVGLRRATAMFYRVRTIIRKTALLTYESGGEGNIAQRLSLTHPLVPQKLSEGDLLKVDKAVGGKVRAFSIVEKSKDDMKDMFNGETK
jgi:hypothetical protein